MYADQAQEHQSQETEWRPDESKCEERTRRALSIEDLRKRLGVEAPKKQEAKTAPPAGGKQERPRIVRRGKTAAAH